MRKLLKINEMTCGARQESETRVRKLKKLLGLRFAASARFAQREQLDWELRVERREIWRA